MQEGCITSDCYTVLTGHKNVHTVRLHRQLSLFIQHYRSMKLWVYTAFVLLPINQLSLSGYQRSNLGNLNHSYTQWCGFLSVFTLYDYFLCSLMLRNHSQNTFYQKRKFQIQFYKEFSQTYENIYFILNYAQDDWYQNKCFWFSFMQNLLHHIYAYSFEC